MELEEHRRPLGRTALELCAVVSSSRQSRRCQEAARRQLGGSRTYSSRSGNPEAIRRHLRAVEAVGVKEEAATRATRQRHHLVPVPQGR